MCSVVCQGLQACLEPRFVDQRFLFDSPKTHYRGRTDSPLPKNPTPDPTRFQPEPEETIDPIRSDSQIPNKPSSEPDSPAWSSIQSLTTTEKGSNCYIHPLAKRSSPTLSERSLKVCTESLGCESGTELRDIDSFFSSSCDDEKRVRVKRPVGRKTGDFRSFPPPLTSISGRDSVYIRSHRQDGRLVMKAVSFGSTGTCFEAVRSDGRLKLFLTNGCCSRSSSVEAAKEEGMEGESGGGDNEQKLRDVNSNKSKCGNGELGVGQFQRPSRCKEGGHGSNKGMLKWEPPCWVATS